ncbi:PBP1A family penicillin-binding protein [Bosea sp. SSUT16]|uniref:PBP1A family penicillin-binding protein n=1 Tax=Bosea spartocytisi TaxID=2773451 RepID=A0A927I206_9HYPH|nr:PBP1A family penicillin-binding protein [Bosea spartocytisi]MBD3847962.1 PBP1A family penicillin-binding protein [Bosea spartocytisi]MCT4470194.1 PBP1A family penicillin-binding protein [Bosea spartocytisi]
MEFRKAGWRTRLKRYALAVDSWLDAGLWGAGRRVGEIYERIRSQADRLTVTGPRRLAAEFASEGLNIGIVGALFVLILALPAFRIGNEEALKSQVLAVTFLDRYGNAIGHRGARHDDSLKLEEMPDHLLKAVIATEDRRFYDHFGIDIIGTFRALTVNARASGVVQGGSSLTQQLAKNLFLSNERSLDRKIKEAFLALWLEARLSKSEILKLYLDRAYMGGGTFGVAAAAEYYFGKSVKDVSLAEAAMLAGLFKAPTKYAPHVNLPAARARANDVLNAMVDAGFMTAGQVDSAKRNPATPVDRKRESSPDYYLDWAFDQVKELAEEGKLGSDRVLTVKTPHDSAIQQRADEAVEAILRQHGPTYRVKQAATVVMDPDGAVRAIVGGRDYGASQFNRATASQRQPGSSFKPYVYATALSAGLYRPNTIVTDRPVCIGNWCPKNYGGSFSGSMPLYVALAKSINSIPVQMSIAIGRATGETHEARAAAIGRKKIVAMGHAMGLTTPLTDTVSLPIGAAEVTVIDQAAGYAVFVNGGKRAKPYAALDIHNSQGELIYNHGRDEPEPQQVLTTQVVQDMNFMLSKVPTEGTGRRAALDGVVTAGKSGTTNGYKDAWYVGFSGNLVEAVWFGNDDSSETANLTGGALPAMTFKEIMQFAHQGLELKPIPGVPVDPKAVTVAKANGTTPDPLGAGMPGAGHMPRQSFEVLSAVGALFKTVEPSRSASRPVQVGIREVSGLETRLR